MRTQSVIEADLRLVGFGIHLPLAPEYVPL